MLLLLSQKPCVLVGVEGNFSVPGFLWKPNSLDQWDFYPNNENTTVGSWYYISHVGLSEVRRFQLLYHLFCWIEELALWGMRD